MLDVLQDASTASLTRSVGRGWSSPAPRLSPLTQVSPPHILTPGHRVLTPQGHWIRPALRSTEARAPPRGRNGTRIINTSSVRVYKSCTIHANGK